MVLILGALTWAIYGQTRHFDYVHFDDNLYIENNQELARGLSAEGLHWAFTANFWRNSPGAEYWQPITLLTRLADYQFYGFKPGGAHATSVLIHLLAGLSLWGMVHAATHRIWESALVATLFLVHPMNVESVCWLSARKDLVCGLFYILALWAYIRYGRKPGWANYLLVTLAVLLANLTKPMTVSLPFAFLCLDFWPLDRGKQQKMSRLLLEKLPFLAMSAYVCLLTVWNLRQLHAIHDSTMAPLLWRVGNAILATGTYLLKAVLPFDLAILYPQTGRNLNLPLTALSAIFLGIIFIAAYRARKSRPWWLVAFLWMLFVLPIVTLTWLIWDCLWQ
jgi:protein O-mannosyl-transferase